MHCDCKSTDVIKDYHKILNMENNFLLQVKVDAFKWKTLYKCKFCDTFWEEINTEDRFIGVPQLIKVDLDYVKREWESVIPKL